MLNRRGGYGMKIRIKYRFNGQEMIAQLLIKNFEKVKKSCNVKLVNV